MGKCFALISDIGEADAYYCDREKLIGKRILAEDLAENGKDWLRGPVTIEVEDGAIKRHFYQLQTDPMLKREKDG